MPTWSALGNQSSIRVSDWALPAGAVIVSTPQDLALIEPEDWRMALDAAQTNYLKNVMRLKVGDAVLAGALLVLPVLQHRAQRGRDGAFVELGDTGIRALVRLTGASPGSVDIGETGKLVFRLVAVRDVGERAHAARFSRRVCSSRAPC